RVEVAYVDVIDPEGGKAAQVIGAEGGDAAAGAARVHVGEEGGDDGDAAVGGVQGGRCELGERLADGYVAVVVDEDRVGRHAEEVDGEAEVGRRTGAVVLRPEAVGGEAR